MQVNGFQQPDSGPTFSVPEQQRTCAVGYPCEVTYNVTGYPNSAAPNDVVNVNVGMGRNYWCV